MELTTQQLYDNLEHFHDVYTHEESQSENPVPDNMHCYVYCSNDSDVEGFAEIEKSSDLGIELLIAKKWISCRDLHTIIKDLNKTI